VAGVTDSDTRSALLEKGALLFAHRGIGNVTGRQLHEAVGARNESALHYHFGGKEALVSEILTRHLSAIETRRAALVALIAAHGREGDVRALVHALAAPMAEDLAGPLGRAHLRLVAQLSHPALAYERPFRVVDAPAGLAVARWLGLALGGLPEPIRRERLALLRGQLISLFALRAQLIDDQPDHGIPTTALFVENLLDLLVAGLNVDPSSATITASNDVH
jgi:AcrR family transcriptional regulator